MENLPSGYRPNFGVCLINLDNQVFVASRLNVPGAWQMPQGGIEDGEEPTSAAIRELREEIGIVSAEIIAEVPEWLTYDFPPTVKAKVNRLWGGGHEWHGQAQKWYLMRMTKDESEINLTSGEADPEFSDWKWASPEEVVELPLCGTDPMLVLEFSMLVLESCPTQTIELFLSGNIPADLVNSYLKQHAPSMQATYLELMLAMNENGISGNLQNEMVQALMPCFTFYTFGRLLDDAV